MFILIHQICLLDKCIPDLKAMELLFTETEVEQTISWGNFVGKVFFILENIALLILLNFVSVMFVNNMNAKDANILSNFWEFFFFLIFNNWLHVVIFVCPVILLQVCNTAWKVSRYGVFSGPNAGKYGPGKTPYLNTFHAMEYIRHLSHRAWRACQINCLLVNIFPTL